MVKSLSFDRHCGGNHCFAGQNQPGDGTCRPRYGKALAGRNRRRTYRVTPGESADHGIPPCSGYDVHPRSATGIADRVRNIRVNHHLLKKHAVCMNDVRGPNKLRALGGYTFTNKRIAGTHFCPLWTQNATTWMRTQYATTWMWHSFDSPCATANTATPRGVNACGCGNTLRGQFTRG